MNAALRMGGFVRNPQSTRALVRMARAPVGTTDNMGMHCPTEPRDSAVSKLF